MTPNPQPQPLNGQNFAPLKPLIELRDKSVKVPEHKIQKSMAERWGHYHRKDQDVFRSLFGVMQLTAFMISGDQDLRLNPATGGWGVIGVRRNTRDTGPINFMQFYANMLMSKSMSSNPDILIRAGRNKDQCISAARGANAVNDHYENIFYTPDFLRNETLLGLTGGTSISRIYFDSSKESNAILADVFEQKNVQMGGGYGFCADCGHSGAPEEFQPQGFGAFRQQAATAGGELYSGGDDLEPNSGGNCPQCIGTNIQIENGANAPLPSVSGQQKYAQGDLVIQQMPLFGLRFDLNFRPEDSSYLLNRQKIALGQVHKVLGNVQLPQGSSQDSDVGMDMLEALAKSGQAVRGASDTSYRREDQYKESVAFDEMWLSPEDYADVIISEDEQTLDGGVLPKGKLLDVFPDGLVAVGLNGMSVLLGLHAEKHKDHVFSWAWNKKMLSGVGRGIADSVEVQIQSNVMNAQRVEYWASTATPAYMYNKELLDANKAKYLGSPKQNIPVDLTKLPETAKLADAVHQFAPTSVPAGFTQYLETFLNGAMAYTTGVTEFSSGLPGAAGENDTATGAQLEQSTADMVNMPIFQEKGGARKRGAEITVKQFVKHCPTKRTIQLTGKYGEQQSIELAGSDLDTDLVYEVVKNSEIPTGPYQTRKNLNDMFTMTQGVEGYMMLVEQKPQLAQKVEQAFDVDLETDNFDDVAELCRKRLNQMKSAVDSGVNDPMVLIGVQMGADPTTGQPQMVPSDNGAIQPPISAVEPNQKRKAAWWSEWLDWDEAQNSPLVLRSAVEMLAKGQIAYQTQQDSALASAQGEVELAQQAPAMQAQAAMQPQEQPDQSAQVAAQQQAAESESQGAEHEAQGAQKLADMVTRSAELKHEKSEGAAQRKHEKEMADKERASKEKLARIAAAARKTAQKRKAS